MLLYGATLHYFSIGLPGIPYPKNLSYLGWDDLAHQIEHVENEVEHLTGRVPLVVGLDRYKTASGLAFYRTKMCSPAESMTNYKGVKTSTDGRHLFGRKGLMYSFWFLPKDLQGATMIIVSNSPDDLRDPSMCAYFGKAGDIKELSIQKNGQNVGRYFYAVFEGYHSLVGG
jgi:dolichol-phosphate mannosyltransferase